MASANNIESLSTILTNCDDNILLSIFNEWAEVNTESSIYNMDEFNDFAKEEEPLDLIRSLDNNFDPDDSFFYIDGYGEYCSSPNVGDIIEKVIDYNTLAKFVTEHLFLVKRILSFSEISKIEDDMLEAFEEYTERKGEIPTEWIEANVDPEEVLTNDWADYYNNLLTDFMEDDEEY